MQECFITCRRHGPAMIKCLHVRLKSPAWNKLSVSDSYNGAHVFSMSESSGDGPHRLLQMPWRRQAILDMRIGSEEAFKGRAGRESESRLQNIKGDEEPYSSELITGWRIHFRRIKVPGILFQKMEWKSSSLTCRFLRAQPTGFR